MCIVFFAFGILIGVDWCQGFVLVEISIEGHTQTNVCVGLALGVDLTNMLWMVTAFCNKNTATVIASKETLKSGLHDMSTSLLHE